MSELKTPFKVGETYKTRRGHSATVLHVGKPDRNFPLLCIHIQDDEENPISHRYDGREFYNQNGPNDLIPPAPPMKRVPLGPEDVPPGSVFTNTPHLGWSAVILVDSDGIRGRENWTWGELMYRGFQIKRPGSDWQPMWKEVPDDSTNA